MLEQRLLCDLFLSDNYSYYSCAQVFLVMGNGEGSMGFSAASVAWLLVPKWAGFIGELRRVHRGFRAGGKAEMVWKRAGFMRSTLQVRRVFMPAFAITLGCVEA